MFPYGPGIAQDITTETAEPLVKYFVDFTGPRAVRLLRQHGLAPGSVVRVFAPGEIQRIFDDLILNGVKGSRFSPRICEVLLEHLILKIAECLMPREASETPAFATYQRCRQHIQSQHLRLRTQAQVARECHVNPAYLCRLFRRYDHQTPYQYLLRLKMNLAAEACRIPARWSSRWPPNWASATPSIFRGRSRASSGSRPRPSAGCGEVKNLHPQAKTRYGQWPERTGR